MPLHRTTARKSGRNWGCCGAWTQQYVCDAWTAPLPWLRGCYLKARTACVTKQRITQVSIAEILLARYLQFAANWTSNFSGANWCITNQQLLAICCQPEIKDYGCFGQNVLFTGVSPIALPLVDEREAGRCLPHPSCLLSHQPPSPPQMGCT